MPEITPSKWLTTASWDETPHLDERAKAELLASTEPHLRDARSQGDPVLGAGAIYPIRLEEILCDPFVIPSYWPRCYGLDVGWRRTAALWLALDRDTDTVYAYTEHYRGNAEPSIHVSAIKARGDWIPGVIDPASRGRSQIDGKRLITEYRALGLKLTPAKNEVEAGIYACWERMSTGRLKAFRTLTNFQNEFRNYHRSSGDEGQEGKIVKQDDHCLHPDTLVMTDHGKVKIADLVGTQGRILTSGGVWTRYSNCRKTASGAEVVRLQFADGTSIVCTPDHRFLTPSGWTEAREMQGKSCYNAVAQKALRENACRSLSSRRPFRNLMVSATTCAETISSVMASAFIALSGQPAPAGPFQTAITSITGTKTRATTIREILSFSRDRSICPSIISVMIEGARRLQPKPQGYGTGRNRDANGTGSILSNFAIVFSIAVLSRAISAAQNLRRRRTGTAAFAPKPAKAPGVVRRVSTMLNVSASNATRRFASIAIRKRKPVAENALVRCLRVSAAGHSDVYCLTVPETEAFAVESGLVVHNCMDAMKYGIMSGLSVAIVEPVKQTSGRPVIGDSTVGY